MKLIYSLATLASWTTLASAHMHLTSPIPLDHEDPDNNRPLELDGSDFPCKGLVHKAADAKPSLTWTAGSLVSFSIKGGAIHGGGSCQASLSVDGGETFRVLHSWEGNCPQTIDEHTFDFRIPSDTPDAKNAIFSWSWLNRFGNREYYQSCAVVNIKGKRGGHEHIRRTCLELSRIPFSRRPQIFVANLAGISSCKTIEGKPVKFPNPGPDVTSDGSETYDPDGECSGPGPAAPAPDSGGHHDDHGHHASAVGKPHRTTAVDVWTPVTTPTGAAISKPGYSGEEPEATDTSTPKNYSEPAGYYPVPRPHQTQKPGNASGIGSDYRPGNDQWPKDFIHRGGAAERNAAGLCMLVGAFSFLALVL
ncbi:hypothetical protein QBC42DRAFT_186663 [Cladorrhinum samala]|uniref:Lytic polysaccharide monooxygenase n=1 Tax=Cladorrhinum samala TaxID=585594 RepID=A0AAV9HBY5_9PEZI|nr:hypothetical protein QBC42DRAFT_186663 [Cladorrhinum samala]